MTAPLEFVDLAGVAVELLLSVLVVRAGEVVVLFLLELVALEGVPVVLLLPVLVVRAGEVVVLLLLELVDLEGVTVVLLLPEFVDRLTMPSFPLLPDVVVAFFP